MSGDEQIHVRLSEIDERLEQVRSELLEFADLDNLDDEQARRFDEL